ncbi:MAG: inositol monophosphatase [Deltaproteobacteria bacterium]|nr:MAG: inositol monophosphatase [Deltaproteobacteria bacterium]
MCNDYRKAQDVFEKAVYLSGRMLKSGLDNRKPLVCSSDVNDKNRQSDAYTEYDVISNNILIKYIVPYLFEVLNVENIDVMSEENKRLVCYTKGGAIDCGVSSGDYCLVIDPLCGSIPYSRGVPDFVVSVALVKEGMPVVGVVYDPIREELFSAILGQGSFLNGNVINASSTNSLAASYLSIEHKVIKKYKSKYLDEILNKILRLRVAGTCGLELCYVACGRIDALIKCDQPLYDYVSGMLILKEAAGVECFTNFDGKSEIIPTINFEKNTSFIATNGFIHEELASYTKNLM